MKQLELFPETISYTKEENELIKEILDLALSEYNFNRILIILMIEKRLKNQIDIDNFIEKIGI